MNPFFFRVAIKSSLLLIAALFVFTLVIQPGEVYAQVDTFEFETDEQQRRFRSLSDELRCPMCQNTSLTGSSGGTAEDLRREVHRMIMEGMTDDEIKQFMFERYGDFIFYKPRLRAETVLLWFGPLLFLIIGAMIAFGIWKKAQAIGAEDLKLDQNQKQRLKELLDNNH